MEKANEKEENIKRADRINEGRMPVMVDELCVGMGWIGSDPTNQHSCLSSGWEAIELTIVSSSL